MVLYSAICAFFNNVAAENNDTGKSDTDYIFAGMELLYNSMFAGQRNFPGRRPILPPFIPR